MKPELRRFLEHCVDAEKDGLVRIRAAAFRAEMSTKTALDSMLELVWLGCLAAHGKGTASLYSLTHYGRYIAGAPMQPLNGKGDEVCTESIERLLERGEAVMASAPRNKAVSA